MLDTIGRVAPSVYEYLEPLRDENECLYKICVELPDKKLRGFETRAYFMRAAYEALTDEPWTENVMMACAATELELCSMYFTNRIFDDKGGPDILGQPHEQVVAAMITRDMAQRIIEDACFKLSCQDRGNVVRKFAEMNRQFYIGQFYEVSNNIFAEIKDEDSVELRQLYELRNRVNYPFYEWIASTAAALAGIKDGRKRALVGFGHEFGMLQQIVNDIADFVPPEVNLGTDTKLPEDAYSDIRHGKLTLPVIEALAESPCSGRELLVRTLHGETASPAELIEITKFMIRSGAIKRTQDAVRNYASRARACLSELPADRRWPFEGMCHIAYSNRYYRSLRSYS